MSKKKNKILLMEPPFYRLFKSVYSLDRYPLSISYLAAVVKEELDWDVVTYNADFYPQNEPMSISYLAGAGFQSYMNNLRNLSINEWKEVKKTIQDCKPDVIGISVKSQNFASGCIVARLAKEINNDIKVIVGGPHPSATGSEVFGCPDIDISVRGEGEKTIVELLSAIAAKKPLDNIRGIIYRKGNHIVENELRENIEDLDTLPFPHTYAKDVLKDYDSYPITAFRNIFAIRGCPYNCFFCGSHKIWSRKPRRRSPENVVQEIRSLREMGLKSVCFNDDTFGVSKQHIKALCNAIINNCPGMKWSCELHVKLVDCETISLMKKAGCHTISLGIESGNNEILKKIRKNITIEEVMTASKIIKKHGIYLYVFFMIGFPHETEDTLGDTVKAMKEIKCDWITSSIFTPYPATEAFDFCRKNNLIHEDHDISLYNHQSPANCFCLNIAPARFRELASHISKMVDEKNKINKLKQAFSFNTLWKVQELGIRKSIGKGARMIRMICGT